MKRLESLGAKVGNTGKTCEANFEIIGERHVHYQ